MMVSGEEKRKGQNLFEEIMAENFLTGEGNRCLDSENPENHK